MGDHDVARRPRRRRSSAWVRNAAPRRPAGAAVLPCCTRTSSVGDARAATPRPRPPRRSNRWWSVPTRTRNREPGVTAAARSTTASSYSAACSGHWTSNRSVNGRQSRPVSVARVDPVVDLEVDRPRAPISRATRKNGSATAAPVEHDHGRAELRAAPARPGARCAAGWEVAGGGVEGPPDVILALQRGTRVGGVEGDPAAFVLAPPGLERQQLGQVPTAGAHQQGARGGGRRARRDPRVPSRSC